VLMCLDGTPARPGNEANTINKLIENQESSHSIFGNPLPFAGKWPGTAFSCLLLFCCRKRSESPERRNSTDNFIVQVSVVGC